MSVDPHPCSEGVALYAPVVKTITAKDHLSKVPVLHVLLVVLRELHEQTTIG